MNGEEWLGRVSALKGSWCFKEVELELHCISVFLTYCVCIYFVNCFMILAVVKCLGFLSSTVSISL